MGVVFARVTHPCQPSPIPLSGRPAHRPFRGLLSVYSRCGLHTRTVIVCRDRYPKASDTSSPPCLLRPLPAGAVAGWGLHPLEKRRLVTAHVETRHLTPFLSSRRRPGSMSGLDTGLRRHDGQAGAIGQTLSAGFVGEGVGKEAGCHHIHRSCGRGRLLGERGRTPKNN